MPMMLVQMQFVDISETERDLIPHFCEWLCNIIFSNINNKINRKKVSLRLKYILDEVNWIHWNSDKYSLSVAEIFEAIAKSIDFESYQNNTWKIIINPNVLIPYSNTSIERLVRFINFGDMKQRATGMFNVEHKYNHKELNVLWKIYISRNMGVLTTSKIISR